MLEDYNKRDKNHLFELIGRRSKETPNFALLIGAGASVTSGVKTSKEMIDGWRQQLHLQSKSDLSVEEWSKNQDWYDNDDEYSILFEKVCDQRSQRRIYIEDCVKDSKPSWGYIYLANIIANNYFNVIFTPNFDDLLNEACFLYANLRPVVCAQDSAVIDVRVTSARPKIIKLHGDFLYDDIKNTVRETESLEKNMRDKFTQFAGEYGLVIIGYGGYDRSIMDILYSVLRSGGSFPNGVYWCVRDKNSVSKKLRQLMRQENIYWVEIEGFDEFMAELHEKLKLKLPDTVSNPYEDTTKKLNGFLSPENDIKSSIIIKDIKKLENKVKEFKNLISKGNISKEEVDKLSPYKFLGNADLKDKNYESALINYNKALAQNSLDLDILRGLSSSYLALNKFDKAIKTFDKLIELDPNKYIYYLGKGRCLTYQGKIDESIDVFNKGIKNMKNNSESEIMLLISRANSYLIKGNWKKALDDSEKVLKINPNRYSALINKSLALKNMNQKEEAEEIIKTILPEIENHYHRACALAVVEDKKNMLSEIEITIREENEYKIDFINAPEFIKYKEDPEFKKLVME